MRTIRIHSRVASFATALVLLSISPILNTGASPGLEAAQGTRVPGFQVPDASKAGKKDRGPVEITFTKWVPNAPRMEGVTGGDVPGTYVGEVLQRQVSANPNLQNGVVRLEAIYEVHAGERSFTALIRGGSNVTTGAAILDGVVLGGWRTGAKVHVTFDTLPSCAEAPPGLTCFRGTIRVGREPED